MENLETIQEQERNTTDSQDQELLLSPITFEQLKSMDKSELTKETLGVKSYLNFSQKTLLIEDVVSMAITHDENNIAYIDYCMLEFAKTIYLIKYYAPNIILDPDQVVAQYDYIVENGILGIIQSFVNINELFNIDDLIKNSLESELKRHNTIESILNKHLYLFQDKIDVVIGKIPDFKEDTVNKWIKSLSKTLKNFDPSKMEMIQGVLDLNKSK